MNNSATKSPIPDPESCIEHFHPIGTKLTCYTCLGGEITGCLVAYHLNQKLMLLKLDDPPQETEMSNRNTEGKSLSTEENDNTKHDYTLVNLLYVSAIKLVENGGCDVDKMLSGLGRFSSVF